MAIDFTPERWERVRETNRAWWAGELDRPLMQIVVWGRDPGRREPKLPDHGFTALYGLDTPAEGVVDRWDYRLSQCTYLCDAFPAVWPNLGAGVAAAFLGAELDAQPETVWFRPREERDIRDLRLPYRADSPWLARVKDICRAATEGWQGLVQVAMTDLGGTLDVLSTFRPSERLLLDLYDAPNEVKRLTWEIHDAWFRYFEEIDAVLRPSDPGYSAWAGIYCERPHYMLQCDFCYMISPAMFDEFVRPELAASCGRLEAAFYHLDGPGQLPHLDSLLGIEELRGVQWIPGAGQRDMDAWPEVYRRIRDAGKLIQLYGGPQVLRAVADQLGTARGIVYCADFPADQEAEAHRLIEDFGGA